MSGYIYCLTNASIPGMVKIGKTKTDPHLRAAKISASTGVPTQFEIAWSRRVPDMDFAELDLHNALSEFRVNARREFFRCSPEEAKDRARRLPSFHRNPAMAPLAAGKRADTMLGLALTACTCVVFTAAVQFDLDASTVATAIASLALALTLGFSASGMLRSVKS